MTKANAQYWVERWREALPPPTDADQRAQRLGRDLERYRLLRTDIDTLEHEIEILLTDTDGQVLTSLPGVAVNRAAAFAVHSLPISRFPDAEHLYSATGPAPAMYESATLRRRGRISRQGLAEHRDALMGIAWVSRSTRRPSRIVTPSTVPVGWPRSRPVSRSPATPAV